MTDFTLDTSGAVFLRNRPGLMPEQPVGYQWRDLSPFVQGYVEALFATLCEQPMWKSVVGVPDAALELEDLDRLRHRTRVLRNPAFHYLSPEALALILRDCEPFGDKYPDGWKRRAHFGVKPNAAGGADYWRRRQAGEWAAFPPLTPYLSDEGKVCLKVAA